MQATVRLEGLEDDLRRIVREEIQAALGQADWLGHDAAAELLGVTSGHLYNLRKQVPSHKVGGKRRYRRSELEAYMEAGRRRCARSDLMCSPYRGTSRLPTRARAAQLETARPLTTRRNP